MTPLRSLTALGLFLITSFAWAQNENAAPQTPAPTPAVTPAPTPSPAEDKLIATVNGEKIMRSDVDARFQAFLTRYGSANRPSDDQINDMKQKQWDVKMTIQSRIVEQEAKKENITVTDADMDQKIEESINLILKKKSISREELDKHMQQQGTTLKESFDLIKKDPAFRESILAEKIVIKTQPDFNTVTDDEVTRYYNENLNNLYSSPELVRASHILVKVDKTADDAAKKAAREKIEKILVEAKAENADFAKLAETYSDCPSGKQSGGDLNFFPRNGSMVEPFAAAAFALQPGQISDIVETQFGYHIIKVTDRKPAQTKSLEEVTPEIREQLKSQKTMKKVRDYMESLFKSAQIVYADAPQTAAPNPMEIKPVTQPAEK